MIGMFFSKEDQEKFDSWSKEQVYEAYFLEFHTNRQLEEEIKRLNRRLAEIRYTAGQDGNQKTTR